MGLCSCTGRFILIVINLIILILSLVLIVVGALLKYGSGIILRALFKTVLDFNDSLKSTFHIPQSDDIGQLPFVSEIGLFVMVLGIILFCISFLACCGACCTFHIFLILFVVLMSVMVLIEGIVGGMFLAEKSPLNNAIKDTLGKEINKSYQDGFTTDAFSLSINILQMSLDCCGIRDPKDFQNNVPPSCCKSEFASDLHSFINCTTGAWNSYMFNDEGCYQVIMDKVQDNIAWAGLGLALLLLLQVLEIAFAISIMKSGSGVGPI